MADHPNVTRLVEAYSRDLDRRRPGLTPAERALLIETYRRRVAPLAEWLPAGDPFEDRKDIPR